MLVYDVQRLTKIYPGQSQPANQEITLQIHQGEIFGMLGDNGAGKSTLVRQMANLLRSTSGSIHLLGQPIDRDPLYVPRHVGYMPQDGLALNNLTVSEALYFTTHLRGLSRSQARRECERLLEIWGIQDLRHKNNLHLSGGQRRLLLLAIAMAGSPPVLILDEPTNDLDPLRRKQVWDVLRQVNQQGGTTIIFITHDAIEAEKIIQRVGVLRHGQLVALGKPSELKALVDQKLRLELFFPPSQPPNLPPELEHRTLEPGRWLVYLERSQAAEVLHLLNLQQVDDFRLFSATLEDLYLYYAQQT